MAERRTDTRRSFPGLVFGRILGWWILAVIWLFFALILSVLVEWAGIIFEFWGRDHALEMLNKDVEYLGYLPATAYGLSAAELALNLLANLNNNWGISRLVALGETVGGIVSSGVTSAVNIFLLFVVRFSIVICAAPAFVLIAIVAFIDGLTERDIRRHCGAPESSFIYHIAKPWILPIFTISAVLYLTMPVSINPFFVFAPAQFLMAVAIYLAASKFKQFA